MYYKTLHEREHESVYKGHLFYDRMGYLWNRGEINLKELAKDINTTYNKLHKVITHRLNPLFDEEFNYKLYGYFTDEYKPMSNKPVVAICKDCGNAVLCSKRSVTVQKGVRCLECDKKWWDKRKQKEEIKEEIKDIKRNMKVTKDHKLVKYDRYDDMFPNMVRDYALGVLNVKETAKALGVSQTSIYNHLNRSSQRYKIPSKQRMSATLQGIPLSEWQGYTTKNPYCEKFNESCRERNRDKYGNKCFVCGKTKEDNGNRRLSVHHVSRDKMDGCNGAKWNLIPLCASCHSKAHHEPWVSRINYLLTD